MHFSVGREHLYTIANTGDKLTGPIVLDVSKLQADGFVDAVTGEIVPVRDGYLTVELEPHALAMLYTAVTTGRLFPVPRVTASDED